MCRAENLIAIDLPPTAFGNIAQIGTFRFSPEISRNLQMIKITTTRGAYGLYHYNVDELSSHPASLQKDVNGFEGGIHNWGTLMPRSVSLSDE